MSMHTRIREWPRGLRALVPLSILALAGGCAVVGVPPEFAAQAPSCVAVAWPEPPAPLPSLHLQKTLERPQSPERLADVGRSETPASTSVIYYPGWRLATEKEVVASKPNVSVEVTARGDELAQVAQAIKGDKCRIVMLDFKNEAAAEGASGRLAADFFYRAITREADKHGVRVQIQDRRDIWDVIKDEAAVDEALVDESEEALLNGLKKIKYSGLVLSGAVTTYLIQNNAFLFPYVIDTESFARFSQDVMKWREGYEQYARSYDQQYAPAYLAYHDAHVRAAAQQEQSFLAYNAAYANYAREYGAYTQAYWRYARGVKQRVVWGNLLTTGLLTIFTHGDWPFQARPASQERMLARVPRPAVAALQPAVPKHQWPAELPEVRSADLLLRNLRAFYEHRGWTPTPQSRVATVCNIGITFRLADGRTSRIVCIGNGDVRDVSPQEGMRAVCDRAAEELFRQVVLKDSAGGTGDPGVQPR